MSQNPNPTKVCPAAYMSNKHQGCRLIQGLITKMKSNQIINIEKVNKYLEYNQKERNYYQR